MAENRNIPQENTPNIDFEKKIQSLYDTITPDPAFVRQLSQQVSRQTQLLADHRPTLMERLRFSVQRRPVLAVGMAVLLVLIIVVALAGPQQVLASVQRLLGYVPGTGFVTPGETRLLAAPVEATQEGVTLRVEKVVADAKQTEINLTVSGLPHEKWTSPVAAQDPYTQPYLLLPNGQQIASMMSMTSSGDTLQASYIFGALPKGVTQFTLVLPRLPSIPVGFAPQNWSIPIQLVTVKVSPTGAPGDLLVGGGYVPATNLAQGKGVSVQVAQVGQSPAETGVQVQFGWDNPEWTQLNNVELRLSDGNGHVYNRVRESMELAGVPESLRTYRFQPFEAQASEAILTVEKLYFTFDSKAQFTYKPGGEITLGQPVNVSSQPGARITIAGVPVQVMSVTISQGSDEGTNPQAAHYHLEVLLQGLPANGLALEGVAMSTHPDLLVSSSAEVLPGNQVKVSIDLDEPPRGPVALYFPHGEVSLDGPWVVRWEISRR